MYGKAVLIDLLSCCHIALTPLTKRKETKMTTTKQKIITAFSEAFNKYFYNELVIGKLAHHELKDHVKKGD